MKEDLQTDRHMPPGLLDHHLLLHKIILIVLAVPPRVCFLQPPTPTPPPVGHISIIHDVVLAYYRSDRTVCKKYRHTRRGGDKNLGQRNKKLPLLRLLLAASELQNGVSIEIRRYDEGIERLHLFFLLLTFYRCPVSFVCQYANCN